ncbi:hypothetical protein F5B18DRAFT_655959 [Nemania serpens]|nr:hypothetical protein F5B18DRAFT_655959 [Nemania serpens]
MEDALRPVIAEIESLNSTTGYTTNNTLGGRLILRWLVQTTVSALVGVMETIAAGPAPWQINGVAANVTHPRVGSSPASNAARFRAITLGGSTYMNEATFDNPTWKEDYFGRNYEALLVVKQKDDPTSLF